MKHKEMVYMTPMPVRIWHWLNAFGIVTLCVFYWIFKLILIRRSSIPVELGKKIAYDMIEFAEYMFIHEFLVC